MVEPARTRACRRLGLRAGLLTGLCEGLAEKVQVRGYVALGQGRRSVRDTSSRSEHGDTGQNAPLGPNVLFTGLGLLGRSSVRTGGI